MRFWQLVELGAGVGAALLIVSVFALLAAGVWIFALGWLKHGR